MRTLPNGRQVISILTYASLAELIFTPRTIINKHTDIINSMENEYEKQQEINHLYQSHIDNCDVCQNDGPILSYHYDRQHASEDMVMLRYWDMKINTRVIHIHCMA